MLETGTLGAEFATALVDKDFERVRTLLHPAVDFRAMTPSRFWEAGDPDAVVSEILEEWLEASDEVESLDALEAGTVGDCQSVGYRFSVRNPDGRFVVEQQAYLTAREGKIGWMRVMCSGFRPAVRLVSPASDIAEH